MAQVSIQPKRCNDPGCRGKHAAAERVALAALLCRERGVQLTKLRQQILELLWQSEQPTGAYELMEALRHLESRNVTPPTVYRSLSFLISQGLAIKIESWNAYVPCVHPERGHDHFLFLCSACRSSVEVEDQRLSGVISQAAGSMEFRPQRRVIEVEGICKRCVSAGSI
ncbi:MAG: Fur family transcriptional regulator [Pseudomonadota bacterium]